MTKAQLITDLQNFLGPGVDVDATGLTTWINDAYGYICDMISQSNPDYFTKVVLTNSIANQQEYTLPSDFERLLLCNLQTGGVWYRVEMLQNIGLIPVHEDTTGSADTGGRKFGYISGSVLGLAPIPTDSVTSGIKIWYVYIPAELSADSDTPIFPSKYHHLIKLGAAANYMDRLGDHAGAQALRQQFEERVENAAINMDDSQLDSPKRVVITQGSDLYVDSLYSDVY